MIKLNIFYRVLESGGTMKTRKWKKLYSAQVSFVCPYCLKTFPLSQATRDHCVPKNRGGKTTPDNIVLSCQKCNSEKGSLTPEEYAEWLRLEKIRHGGKVK